MTGSPKYITLTMLEKQQICEEIAKQEKCGQRVTQRSMVDLAKGKLQTFCSTQQSNDFTTFFIQDFHYKVG